MLTRGRPSTTIKFEKPNAAELLSESCGNDIRQVLNCLQMWQRNRSAATLKYMDMKQRLRQVEKDAVLRLTAFDGATMILDPLDRPLHELSEGFFRDYMLVPLLVQENYANALQNSRDKTSRLERLCYSAEALSDADIGKCKNIQVNGTESSRNKKTLNFLRHHYVDIMHNSCHSNIDDRLLVPPPIL